MSETKVQDSQTQTDQAPARSGPSVPVSYASLKIHDELVLRYYTYHYSNTSSSLNYLEGYLCNNLPEGVTEELLGRLNHYKRRLAAYLISEQKILLDEIKTYGFENESMPWRGGKEYMLETTTPSQTTYVSMIDYADDICVKIEFLKFKDLMDVLSVRQRKDKLRSMLQVFTDSVTALSWKMHEKYDQKRSQTRAKQQSAERAKVKATAVSGPDEAGV